MKYIWKSRESSDYWSSESSDEGSGRYSSRQATLIVHKHCNTQFMKQLCQFQFRAELESKAGKWKQLNKDGLQYDYSHSVGLPSHVHGDQHLRSVRSLRKTEKEILVVGNTEQKQKSIHDVKKSKPSISRRRNAELQNGIGDRTRKQISEKMSCKNNRRLSPSMSKGTISNCTSKPKMEAQQVLVPVKKYCRPLSERKSVKFRHSSESTTVFNSYAVVKSSYDPQKDFRDSMLEMVRENNIRCCRDLEQLLKCYLFLNSDECHSIIIKAFEQVRSDIAEISLY